MALARILRRNSDWVQVPRVVIVLRPPVDGLVPSREPLCAVQPVPKMPDNPIAELESLIPERRVEYSVERDYLSVIDVVSDLPAD